MNASTRPAGPEEADARHCGHEVALGELPLRQNKRQHRRPFITMIVAQIVLALVIAATAGLLAVQTREQTLADAALSLRNQALLVADQAERSFEAVEVLQSGLAERMQVAGMRTPDDFRRAMSGYAVYQDLRDRKEILPQLDAITAIDADGNLLNFSRYWPIPKVNVADRDYFKALKSNPELHAYISEPVPNRGTGSWSLYLARKVSAPDGTFLGLILGAVQLAYFEELYQAITTTEGFAAALFRSDGVLLARFPLAPDQIGRSFANGPMFKRLGVPGAKGAQVLQQGQIEGVPRLIAGRRLERQPLLVTVTSTVDSLLVAWRRQTFYLVATAAVLELVLAAVGLMTVRHLRAQEMLTEARAAQAEAEASLAVSQERDRAGREREQQNVRFGAALDNMSQALCMFDHDDHLIVANRRLADIFGLAQSGITSGLGLDELLCPDPPPSNLHAVDADLLRTTILQLRAAAARGSDIHELSDGRTLALSFAPVEAQDWLVTLEDITERRTIEAKISHMAHHDALTGLPNRVLFHQRLAEAVARSRRGDPCAVLYLDLDHFKAVNDSLGHPIGDALLREVTRRLRRETRDVDTVARLGGDEFAIVQSCVIQPQDAITLAVRLIEAISAPYHLDGHQVIVGTSIGIAIVPADGDNPDQLLRAADMALYRSKADGRGRYSFFEPEMDAKMQARRALEMDLRDAFAAGAFEVFYQPLMSIKRRTVIGFEALLRWHHPKRGLVSPADFIPLAEEIGLIIPLGEWVLRQACADAARWPGKPKVAVNLSPLQFGSKTLVADVASALQDSGLDPARLELEITETVMLEDTDAILAILHRLKALGVGIAMDDFGTGYSSLSYLRRFPFSKVKIDRSFIEGLGGGGDNDAIVSAVTDLCESLGMTTTAEGVETEEQLKQLLEGKCTEAQGYLFSKPRPASEVAAMCEQLGASELV